jgi:autotransporter adhesin
MDTDTTFSADNLIASAIRTTNLQSTSISASSISTNSLQSTSIRSDSVTTGVLTVTGNASIGGTLNINNNRIINVGDGVEPSDAVNLRQLQRTETHISDLRKESRGGIASVAALVGIPVTPFGSDGALGVAVGSYKGESSVAISGSRQVNDKATIKLGISTPSGNNGVVGSFGVGIKW